MKCNQKIRLVGEKAVLVPYRRSHVPKYHAWMQDAELRQLTASEPLSLEAEYEMQKKWAEDEDKCTFIVLSKQCLDERKSEIEAMVGDVNLFLVKDDEDENAEPERIAELELMIAERDWRGRGLGKEVAMMMILYGVDHLRIRKFQVKISSKNVSSLNLFEKLAFHRLRYSEVFDEVTLVCDFDNCSNGQRNEKMLRDKCVFTVDAVVQEENGN